MSYVSPLGGVCFEIASGKKYDSLFSRNSENGKFSEDSDLVYFLNSYDRFCPPRTAKKGEG